MLGNYLASAIRNLMRNRLYAAINVGGLAVWLAAAILIALFVRDEFSYDRFLPDHERIFLVSIDFTQRYDRTTTRVAGILKSMYPQVEAAARLMPGTAELRRGKVYAEESIHWADADFFEIFKLPTIAGDLRTALQRPDGAVVT